MHENTIFKREQKCSNILYMLEVHGSFPPMIKIVDALSNND